MAKKLYQIIAPIILAGAAVFSGCQNPYENFKNGKFNYKQQEFLDNIHNKYGPEVSYDEMKEYIYSKFDNPLKAKIAKKILKRHLKKNNCLDNIEDKTLVLAYEAIRNLD